MSNDSHVQIAMWEKEAKQAARDARRAALAIVSLANTSGMPDSYKQTDRRMVLARTLLKRYPAVK